MRERRRKLLRGLLYLALALGLIVFSLPAWLPWILRPVVRNLGFAFGEYHRESYSRFSAGDLTYSNLHIRFSAERVSASIPFSGQSSSVRVSNWRLEILPKPPRATARNRAPSVHRVFRQTERIVGRVMDWISRGSATNGVISWPEQVLRVPSLEVFPDRVAAQVAWSNLVGNIDLRPGDPHELRISVPATNLAFNIIVRGDETSVTMWSTNRWLTNDFALNAHFGRQGLLPDQATLDARSPIPASLAIHWQTNQFTVTATAEVPVRTNRVSVRMEGRGDTNSLLVTRALFRGFGVEATNIAPVAIAYAPPYLGEATFGVRADLGEQHFFPALGHLRGEVFVSGTSNRFALRGANLLVAKQAVTEFVADGSIAWPILNGSIRAKSDLGIVTADFTGPFTNLNHSGEIRTVPLSFKRLKPLTAEARWTGTHLVFNTVSARVAAGDAVLDLAGNANTNGLTIGTLTLQEAETIHLRLEHPVRIRRNFRFDPVKLSGRSGAVAFAGEIIRPSHGKLEVSADALRIQLLNSFLSAHLTDAVIDRAALSANWNDGPVDFDLSLSSTWEEHTIKAQLAGTNNQITIKSLDASGAGLPFGTLQGTVPVAIHPGAAAMLQVRMDDPLELTASVSHQSHAWDLLTNRFDLFLTNATAYADVSGTLRNPLGRIRVNATELRFREALPDVPPFRDLALDATVTGGTAKLERLTFSVAGQPVFLQAHMPLPRDTRKFDWRTVSASLRIDEASLAPFAPLLRGYASPEGVLRARVALNPGGNLDGEVIIDGASTRPFPNLGALDHVEVICRFSERLATVKSVGALGGESIFAVGQVELGPEKWAKQSLPPFELQVHGENVPLSRGLDSVIRGDINVTLLRRTNEAPLIRGGVNLRNSLYLRDLRDLIPGGVESPAQRPPYFSIEEEGFAKWQLDLDVTGREFLQVRTPLFVGVISADLTLTGTLKDPVAVGDLSIDSGTVRLPFATLPVTQGFVTLSRENPYRPELYINAADRAFGYDVKMAVTGPATSPLIQFSSTPPLSSEQVLLMLTAGEVPRQNAFTFTTQQRAQRLALFFGRGLLSEFGLGGDASRLTIRSGENITDTGRPTYSVEYELSEDWSVIGQYDRFNDFNLMLKWQVYAR